MSLVCSFLGHGVNMKPAVKLSPLIRRKGQAISLLDLDFSTYVTETKSRPTINQLVCVCVEVGEDAILGRTGNNKRPGDATLTWFITRRM